MLSGFEIAVGDPGAVRGVEARWRSGARGRRCARRQPDARAGFRRASDSPSRYSITRYRVPRRVEPDVEDLDDAGVLDPRHRARLVEERCTLLRIGGDLGEQDLDRDAGADALLLGEIHLPHPAAARGADTITEVPDRLAITAGG